MEEEEEEDDDKELYPCDVARVLVNVKRNVQGRDAMVFFLIFLLPSLNSRILSLSRSLRRCSFYFS